MFKFNITIFNPRNKQTGVYYKSGQTRFLAYLDLYNSIQSTTEYPFLIEDP